MDREKLLAFNYTFTLGSTVSAAAKLRVKPSSVSKLLRSLEKEVGHELLTRKGKYLALTEKGKIFFETAQNLLAEYDLSLEKMAKLSQGVEGQFTIAISPFISILWFTQQIIPFLEAHPEVSFNVINVRNIADFKAREVDIDIRPVFSDSLEKEGFRGQYLTTYDLRFYASQNYIEKRGLPHSIEELKAHTLISFASEGLFYYNDEPQHMKAKQTLIIDCPLSIAYAVENDLGIGPLLNLEKTSPQPLVPVLHDHLSQSLDIFYNYPETLASSPTIREFYDYLRALPKEALNQTTKLFM